MYYLSVIWSKSYHSANTRRDQAIKDQIPRLNVQPTSRTTSHHANGTSNASHRQAVDHPTHHANGTSKASRRQTVDHPINRDNLRANNEINNRSNDDADNEDEDDSEDEVNQDAGPKIRRPRTLNNDIRSSQLRFYSGTWVDILTAAKNNYRLFIHNEDPFPERSSADLEDAHVCLLDAVGKFKEDPQLTIDEGMLIQS